MLAAAPFNWQLTDSYFVIAHFQLRHRWAIVFMIFAATYYWFPKATGRLLDERLGRWHFWLFVIGFHITFDPMHFSGILGMPRRIYTYGGGPRLGNTQYARPPSARSFRPPACWFSFSTSCARCARPAGGK